MLSILFHYFLCSLPLPLLLQGWKGCLLTSGVVSIYLLVVDGETMGSQGEVGQGFSQLWPSLEACLAFFLYLCLSVVAGLEGLSHREHEARAFWHGFTFLGLSLSLSPIDFIGVEGLALEGRSGKTLSTQTMTLLWAGEVGQGSLRYGLTFGLPLHVFVVCCWGGRVVP